MAVSPEEYQQILGTSGAVKEVLSASARAEALRAWRETYAAGLHAARGVWKYRGFDWHVFSYEHARARNGDSAMAAYMGETISTILVCPEDGRLPAVRLACRSLPDFRGVRADVIVWPEDLSWTMAFTHEESLGLGPYFSRQEWIVAEPRAAGRRPRRRG